MARTFDQEANNLNIIGSGTDIKGDINSVGDIRIDGVLTGNLHSKAKLVLGESGKIFGEITCKNAEISGEIKGKIVVEELLVLRSTANINGDIFTTKLSIEPDALFTGTCNMQGNVIPTTATTENE